jgi:hypothetical protein
MAVLMVLTRHVKGQAQEFNQWYDEVHLPELLALPAFQSARRYRVSVAVPSAVPQEYLAVYDVTDAAEAAAQLSKAELTLSESLDLTSMVQGFFDELPSP